MAKKNVASMPGAEQQAKVKVVKAERSSKTGAYAFREEMVPADKVSEYTKK